MVKIKSELVKLGPLINLEAIREPQGPRTEGGLTAESNHRARLAFRALSPGRPAVPFRPVLRLPKAAGAVFSEDDLVGDPVIRPAHGRPPEGPAAVSQSS